MESLKCTIFSWFRIEANYRENNKVRKALYSIKGFLKNPHISIPYKRMLFSAIVIGKVSYYAPLLGSNERMRSVSQFRFILD